MSAIPIKTYRSVEKVKTETIAKFVRFLVSARFKKYSKDKTMKKEDLVGKSTIQTIFRPNLKFTKLFTSLKTTNPVEFMCYFTTFSGRKLTQFLSIYYDTILLEWDSFSKKVSEESISVS